jgi:hypothetical protein
MEEQNESETPGDMGTGGLCPTLVQRTTGSPQPKPKKPLSEAQLRRIAQMQIKAAEKNRKKGELSRALKAEKEQQFEKLYEEKVIKKKSLQTPKKQIDTPPPNTPTEEENEGSQNEPPKKLAPVGFAKGCLEARDGASSSHRDLVPPVPDYKNEYYRLKMEGLLEQKLQQEQQTQFKQNYLQLPFRNQMIDVARNNIRKTVDKKMMQNVYQSLYYDDSD